MPTYQEDRHKVTIEMHDLHTGLRQFLPRFGMPPDPEEYDRILDRLAEAIHNGIWAGVRNETPGNPPAFPSHPDLDHDTNILAECVHSLAVGVIKQQRGEQP